MENYHDYYDGQNPSGQSQGQSQSQSHDENAMHVDFDPGMHTWPWMPEQTQGQQVEFGNTPFLIPGYEYLDEGVLHQSEPQSPQPPPSAAVPLAPEGPAAKPSSIPTRPGPNPTPKVAIPRSKSRENASHRRRRSARACEPCRQRKIKCDGDRPVCRQCMENQISCAYLDIKRVREQKQLGVLARRVEVYEALLREIEPEVEAGAARKIRRALKVFSSILICDL